MVNLHSSFRLGLRSSVLEGAASEASRLQNVELSQVWLDVSSGHERIVDGFYSDEGCFLMLESRTPPESFSQPGSRRNVRILERVLLGQAQKAIALDLDLAASTVAFSVAECLEGLGLPRRVCRVPTLLVAAAHAARGRTDLRIAGVSIVEHAGLTYRVLSAARPDAVLRHALSPAEFSVARLLVEGLTHAEIAAARQASTRTIANQLATAFHKLGVSGRSELLCAILSRRPRLDANHAPWSAVASAQLGRVLSAARLSGGASAPK